MKKMIILFLFITFACASAGLAMDFKIVNLRDRIFEQSKDIQALISPRSRDNAILTSMFDTCLLTATQLDAYFSMLGIFESVKKENSANEALKFIVSWLNGIKNTNTLSIQSLNTITQVDQKVKAEIKKLSDNLQALSTILNAELNKLAALTVTVNKGK